jgi:Holliday junction resolvase-like predicted endonuclease
MNNNVQLNENGIIGKYGEFVAEQYIIRFLGGSILAKNIRIGGVEIDILAIIDDYLVLVEVKNSACETFLPEENISSFKRNRIYKAMQYIELGRLFSKVYKSSSSFPCAYTNETVFFRFTNNNMLTVWYEGGSRFYGKIEYVQHFKIRELRALAVCMSIRLKHNFLENGLFSARSVNSIKLRKYFLFEDMGV